MINLSDDEGFWNETELTSLILDDDRTALEENTDDVQDRIEDAVNVVDAVEGILMEEEPAEDILEIATKLLKQAGKVNTQATLKHIMILTAIVSYVKLYRAWKNTGARHWKQPAKTASIAVVARMGKGPTFARMIWEMVPYVLKYQRLPENSKQKKLGAATLLDNEAVVVGIQWYLAEQKLGMVRR